MWLPKLPSCEAVGWIKTAALGEALDSFLTGAAASPPVPRSIPGCLGAAGLERSRAALSCRCVALFGLGRDRSRSSPGAGSTSAPHPRAAGKEQLCSRGMCASVSVSFWGNEAKCASPLPSLPVQPLKRQRQAVLCAGPGSCALQVAEASALWQLFLGQRRGFCRAQWVSSDASHRYNTANRDITALDAF